MKDTVEDSQHGRGVRSVSRALKLLQTFEANNEPLTLAWLARSNELAPSTALRLLQTLEEEEFLTRQEDGLYVLGPAVLRLGFVAKDRIQLSQVSGPHLEQLTRVTGETTNLGVPIDGGKVLYVDQRLSTFSLRAHSWLGRTVPIEGTAIGSAMSGTVNDDGWCIAKTTLEPGVTAVAAPIYDSTGAIVAAINITGPTGRVLHRAEEFGGYLVMQTSTLTTKLGGAWPHRLLSIAGAQDDSLGCITIGKGGDGE